jgi:hypothetical protein
MEMSTRNLPGGKGGQLIRLTALPPSVSGLYRRCVSVDVSQPYGPSLSVTAIALHFFFTFYVIWQIVTVVLKELAIVSWGEMRLSPLGTSATN